MPLPQQMKLKRLHPPNRRQLQHWAEVCRYIDAQTMRTVWSPFPDDPPISFPLLRNMSRFKLVRHRNSDCTWQVARNWEMILQRLAKGLTAQEDGPATLPRRQGVPFVVDYGIDTLYVNVLAEDVPFALWSRAQDLKAQAQIAYESVETPWRFGDAPLSLLPNGKGASKSGGVSWGLIFRNHLVEIRLRVSPISGIVAAVHFLAECLWVNGNRVSLDLMVRCLRAMWADPDAFKGVRYQLSQIHLCADIAHFPLDIDHLPRLVTHSLKRTIHTPSQEDLALDDSVFTEGASYSDDDDALYYGSLPDEWDVALVDPADEIDDEWEEDETEDDDHEAKADEDATTWDDEGGKVHWRGKQIEGFGFSPSGALSAAWYDKILEERKSRKAWMREIHQAGGWEPGIVLTRLEYRHKRPILGELEVALGHEKGQHWFDDPWVALEHLGDLWAFDVGLPPEHDYTPDVTYRGWMRLAVQDDDDSTRSRWKTDPLWEVVQRVPFAKGVPKPLRRVKLVKPDIEHIDVEIRGLLVTRAMLRGSYLKAPANSSRELEDFDDWLADYERRKGRDFADDVRERARMAGKPVPYKAPLVLDAKHRSCKKKTDGAVS